MSQSHAELGRSRQADTRVGICPKEVFAHDTH